MDVNYKFVPEYKSAEIKEKSDLISYAGKLLEFVDEPMVLVSLDENNSPVVYAASSVFTNRLDFDLETY